MHASGGAERVGHVGFLCEELGIREDVVMDVLCERETQWTKLSSVFLVNGVVVELNKWLKDQNRHVKWILKVLTTLFDVDISDANKKTVLTRVDRCVKKHAVLRKRKSRERDAELQVHERTLFNSQPNVQRQVQRAEICDGESMDDTRSGVVRPDDELLREVESLHSDKDRLQGILQNVRLEKERAINELDNTRNRYKSEVGKVRVCKRELKRAKRECFKLRAKGDEIAKIVDRLCSSIQAGKKMARKYHVQKRKQEREISSLKRELRECRESLLEVRPLLASTNSDVMKEAESGDVTVSEKQRELEECRSELRDVKKQLSDMSKELEMRERKHKNEVEKRERKIDKLRKQKQKIQRREITRIRGVKSTRRKVYEESQKRIAENVALRKKMGQLRNELIELSSMSRGKPVSFRHRQRYDPRIRAVYQDLLQKYGVSTANCEGVVRTILEGLTNMDVQAIRLPKKSIAADMFLEGRKMAQIQIAKSLAEQDMTLSSDATSKFGHHYMAYDIYKGSGESSSSMMIGMRESEGGTAQTMLQTLLGILHELSDMPSSNQTVNKILANIKNTMSDRHVVEKKFNELLSDYRQSILPSIVQGWAGMSEDERAQFTNMNSFFCALHYLVGLADYASTTIQAWEKMIFREEKVGAQAVSGERIESECGTVRLVRTVCKSVQDRVCEKSGQIQFRTFLRSKNIKSVPLAPFKGNRFNILFHNSAGVAYLTGELKEFFEKHKEDNLLFKAVHADLAVNQYLAAARALGLIDKLVTGPLWRVINEPGHITDMNERYKVMHECFSRWSEDSSRFMRGNDVLFEDEQVPSEDSDSDPVYESLVQPNPQLDNMTRQILELIFLTFCQVTEKMLVDHLPSGSNVGMSEKEMRQTRSVPRTNVGVERDFGMLDRIIRLKPSASMLVYESIIMSVRNKTSEWRKDLSITEREELMEYARKSVRAQKEDYSKRVKQLWDEREEKQKTRKQNADDREEKNRVRSDQVYADVVTKCGGIWLSEKEVHEKLHGVGEKQCTEMLQAQLQARKHVLGEKNVKGNLNLSEKGRKKSMLELKESLLSIIRVASERTEHVDNREEVHYTNMHASQESVTEFRMKVQEKRRKEKTRVEAKRVKGKEVKYNNFLGKIVDHLTVGEDGKKGWYRAIVIGKSKNGLKLSYDYEPGCTYEFTQNEIEEYLHNGDLKVVDLRIQDVVGLHVMHRFLVEAEKVWFRGYISSATKEQECLVIYDPVEDDEGEDVEDSWEGPILDHYWNNDVRFVRPE